MLVLLADHEAGDVLQEQQRDLALRAQLDEVRALERAFGKHHPVVGDHAHRLSVQVGKAGHQRGAVAGLELVQARAIHHPCDQLAHLVGLARIGRDDAVQLLRVIARRFRRNRIGMRRRRRAQVGHDLAQDCDRMRVVFGVVIGHAGNARMHIGPAQFFGTHHFTGGGLDQRRAAQKDGALVLDDHRLLAHRRHVGATGGARTHHAGDLRDAQRRQVGLVVEDPAEVVAIGKHLVLQRQVGAARVHQVQAGQMVLQGHFLRAQVFLDRHRIVGAALDGGIVGHDHAGTSVDAADAGDHAAGRHLALVHVVGGQQGQFEEGRSGIDQQIDPLAHQQLAACHMLAARRLAAAAHDRLGGLAQLVHQLLHGLRVGAELRGAGADTGDDRPHLRAPR